MTKGKNKFVYIPCQGVGEYCSELYKELQLKVRYRENPDKTVLSIIDDEVINYCPFCGRYINRR